MSERRKIALLLGEPDERDQNNFIEGFLEQAFKHNMDVCIFAMYQMYQDSANREIGDSKIFSLVPFDKFDAVVVMADTIQTAGVLEQIESELKEYFSGKVLFVDKESQCFPSVSMDDYNIARTIMNHLLDEHGYKDIAYLTGKSWNVHAVTRLNSYCDAMKEHGLLVREDRIFYGDFWYTSGATMVDKLMKHPEDLPEVIACANNCMAIGVANALSKVGVRVPEDIAVVGYDYSVEGALSPNSLTAAYVPYDELGKHAVDSLISLFENENISEFKTEGKMFVGSSCGCEESADARKLFGRDSWETENSYDGFRAKYNTMMENLLCQNRPQDLYNVISSYTYQLREIDSFNLCLNKYWANEETLLNPDNEYKNYTDEMYLAVRVGEVGEKKITAGCVFDTADLLPDFDEERDVPKAFFFTPVFFEDNCMGYAVLSYGNKPRNYSDMYHAWMNNVMLGLECLRRMVMSKQTSEKLESGLYIDQGTGLNNYKGLMKQAEEIVAEGKTIKIVAVDIKGLSKINKAYGRDEGNLVISIVGSYVKECKTVEFCCCLGNDEFLLGTSATDDDIVEKMKAELLALIEKGNKENDKYQIAVCMGEVAGSPSTVDELERLINEAVSRKNGNKILEQRKQDVVTFTEEEKKIADVVKDILDNNKFVYNFQPIISAKTGEIYSYEALMRSNTEVRVSPLDILKYAEALGRLDEVERFTFVNVMQHIKDNDELFEGKKVFINSIPGVSLSKKDTEFVNGELKSLDGQAVVELTEQAELKDDELAKLKTKYLELGVETAVDDYGTGYSNVTNLLRYMPRYVKIDRMLLSEIQNSPQKQHFVNEIIEFAHNNNIMALAEGVETVEELEMVIRLGADLIQGYYVAKPSAEVIQTIPVKVKREIHQYNLQEQYNKNKKLYVAGREFRVSLAKLASEGYECILITNDESAYRDFSIVGVPGSRSDIVIQIADGYHGRVQLENVSLGGKRGKACINIGEDCDVCLVIQGENELRTGGICVPEGSKLTFEGTGNLGINCNFDNYFAIGNTVDARHGDIIFEQEGEIEIIANGTMGVSIGSGLGGNIFINSGKLVLGITGKRGAAIGCIEGDTVIKLASCDVFIDASIYAGVAVGTMNGKATITGEHMALNIKVNGTECVGIGACMSNNSEILLHNWSSRTSIHSPKACGIGTFEGDTSVSIQYASIKLDIEGDEVAAVGSFDDKTSLELVNGEIVCDFITEAEKIYGVEESKRFCKNGRLDFTRKGSPIQI